MKTIELGHAVLYVRDLERSRHFYGEVLGPPRDRSRVPRRGRVQRRAHAPRAAAHRGRPVGGVSSAGPPHRPLPPRVQDRHDRRRAARRDPDLQDAGVTIVGASDHTVTHSLYIQDPDGNELELYIDVQPERWRDDPALVMAPIKPLHL